MPTNETSETAAPETELELEQSEHEVIVTHHSENQLPGKDRLSTLPPELLTIIFEQVGRGDHRDLLLRGICSNLIWYTRKNLYKWVFLSSLACLKLFVRTVVAASGSEHKENLGSLVEYFSFTQWSEEYEPKAWEDLDCLALLKALPHVTSLSITRCQPLTEAVLSREITQNYLRMLRDIHLIGDPPNTNVFNIQYFSNLGFYPNLDAWHLWYCDEFKDPKPDLFLVPSTPEEEYPELRVKTLYTGGDLRNTSEDELAAFLGTFQHLRCLCFEDQFGTLDMDNVFHSVTTELETFTFLCERSRQIVPLHDCLTRFATLKILHLGYQTYDENTLTSIQSCTLLEKLSLDGPFDHNRDNEPGPVSYTALRAFIRDGARPRSLKELFIAFFEAGEQGRNISYLDFLPDDWNRRGWWLPWWPRNFTYENAKAFVEEAKAVGVEVTGAVPHGIEVQAAWEDMVAQIRKNMVEVEEQ